MKENQTDDSLTLIIGIGNRYRSDDAIGSVIAEKIGKETKGNINVIEHDGEASSLMDSWKGAKKVILVDAVYSGVKPPGTIFYLDLKKNSLPDNFAHCSTHNFGVAEAVELARAMGTLPPVIHFYGIEGRSFDTGQELSSELEGVLSKAIELINRDISLYDPSNKVKKRKNNKKVEDFQVLKGDGKNA